MKNLGGLFRSWGRIVWVVEVLALSLLDVLRGFKRAVFMWRKKKPENDEKTGGGEC